MTRQFPFYISIVLIAPLAALYLYFVAWTVKVGAIPPTDTVASILLATLIVRLAVVLSVKRLRRGKASVVVDIFAIDVVVMAGLFGVYAATSDAPILSVLQTLVPIWPAALLLVLPPYVLYRLASGVFEGASISGVVPLAVGLFSLFSVLAITATLDVGSLDLSGVSKTLLSVFLGYQSSTVLARELTFTGIVLYVALAAYAVTGPGDSDLQAPLALAVAGGATALLWLEYASTISGDLLLVAGVPGFVLLGGIWWRTRAR